MSFVVGMNVSDLPKGHGILVPLDGCKPDSGCWAVLHAQLSEKSVLSPMMGVQRVGVGVAHIHPSPFPALGIGLKSQHPTPAVHALGWEVIRTGHRRVGVKSSNKGREITDSLCARSSEDGQRPSASLHGNTKERVFFLPRGGYRQGVGIVCSPSPSRGEAGLESELRSVVGPYSSHFISESLFPYLEIKDDSLMGEGRMGNDKDDRLCCCKDAAGGGEGELEPSLPLSTMSPLPLASI